MDWSLPFRIAPPRQAAPRRDGAVARELIELSDGTTFAAAGKPGMTVRCLRGTVWLTQTRMPGDIILTPGKTFTALHRGKIVTLAMGSAVFELTTPE